MRASKLAKSKSINFPLTSAAQKRLRLSSLFSRRSKVSSKTDPVVIKARAAAAQAFAKKQRESAKEKLKELERKAELQKKLWKAKKEVERVKMEAEFEL